MSVRRGTALGAVGVLLVAGGLADRAPRPTGSGPAPARTRALMPTSAPRGALSSTWFCAGATSGGGTAADGTVVVANPTDRPASGTVRVTPVEGASASAPLRVEAWSSVSVALRDVVAAPFAAALVDLDAGQVAAELVVRGSGDTGTTACSSGASDRWYFADGSTAKDATLFLSLFNPFPEDAIVDLAFTTEQGHAAPAAFRPVVVPARSLVVKDVGQHVRRREAVAAEAVTRTGRVVAAQTQVRTAPGRAGLSVALGAPAPARVWHFPEGLLADGVTERFAVANPTGTEATVLFEVHLEEGVAEPFERTVPAEGRVDVVLDEEVGVPRAMPHGTTVRSLDGVPVVVARAVESAPPAPRSGRSDTLGARRAATRWLFPAGAGAGQDESLVVLNAGTRAATVSVTGLAGGRPLPVDGLQQLTLPPGRRQALPVGAHVRADALPLLVTASAPVVVERRLSVVGGPGLSASMGIALG